MRVMQCFRCSCVASRIRQPTTSRMVVRYASASTKASPETVNPTPVAAPSAPRPKSSVAAGTPLKGLGFHAKQPEPVALPDEEYPDWLWRLLDPPSKTGSRAKQAQGHSFVAKVKGEKVRVDKQDLRRKNKEGIRASNFLKAA